MLSRMSYVFLPMFALAVVTAPAAAATIHVPGDQPTITAAISAAIDGDTISVAAGTYSEGTIFVQKNVTLLGAGAASTTITGGGSQTLFLASTGPVHIEGFTVTGGFASSGAGINVNGGSGGSLSLAHCLVKGNVAAADGAGVFLFNNATATIDHCTFSANTAAASGTGAGAAIGILGTGASADVTSCILWGDTPDEIGLISGGTVSVSYSDVRGVVWPGTGNISADPLFTDAGNGDFTIGCDSPCSGSGADGTDMGAFPAEGGSGTATVSGTVSAACGGGTVYLAGVTVDLIVGTYPDDALYVTSTDGNGFYSFEDVEIACGTSVSAEVSILVPLGYEAVSPEGGEAVFALVGDTVQNFGLACLEPSGYARSKGYWKHQASVYVMEQGSAQESFDDMATNFPAAVFDHFHENDLNSIAVEGVTYMAGPAPLDLDEILSTLRKKGSQEEKAKQQYLALLLNIASGKVMTWTVISDDGATASQAIQYVADLLNDSDPGNDELAKDVAETINHAMLVDAGVIPLTYADIAYAQKRLALEPLRVFPNPGSPASAYTFSFAIPTTGEATLEIFDVAGRRVAAPLAGVVESGRRELRWDGRTQDGRRVAQGVYFARLATRDGVKAVKFVNLAR